MTEPLGALGSGREFDLIRGFLTDAKREHPLVHVGPGDDCAIIGNFAISCDMSVEDVHFRRDWLTPEEIGYRATAAALSDLAAMAAQPVAALVSFSFTDADADGWAGAVMRGATRAIELFDAVLAGGDLTRARASAAIDVTVIGETTRPILRSGAQPGDEIWVTGTLGGAGAAVAALQEGRVPADNLRRRFAEPAPRVREALWLLERVAPKAMIDLSDGIAGDVRHLAAGSGCHIVIDAAKLPVEPGADMIDALQGGEDYELCFAVAAGSDLFCRICKSAETHIHATEGGAITLLTKIGYVEAGEGVQILNGPALAGFDHFRAR